MTVHKKIRLFLIVMSGIILSMTGIGYYLHSLHYVYTDDAYVSGHSAYISPHVAGYVDSILVRDNQLVRKGQLIATIDPRYFVDEVNQSEAQLNQSKAQLKVDKHLVQVAYSKYKFFRTEYKRYELLSKIHAESVEKFQNYTASFQESVSALNAKILRIKKDEASVLEAKANLSMYKLDLSYTKIYAPFTGWVTKKSVALGDYVKEGEDLMAIVPLDLYIQANYKETKLTHLHKGQKVSINIDSYPNVVFKGHVDSIQSGSGAAFSLLPPENATGNFVKIVQRVPVKIVFDRIPDPDKYKLSIGMSVETSVSIS